MAKQVGGRAAEAGPVARSDPPFACVSRPQRVGRGWASLLLGGARR